ncbi:hypothetical protein FPZ12_032400 [Amycolatopsis acidicola]|uniref:Alpha/beta hydrolase n=1 Tax=Amycolatopsis acidicola TaxID=2596893 RepID=A0A5N0UT08_9PSEU|nr:hypothetical protein [Amycolatopsis acidicola]KAA9154308.1 hypothetical protein FPZ12_032400 [Amycolatopsis acidicola]
MRCSNASGTGTPVVLLHGVLATSLSWQDSVARLAAGHPVYAVDSLGEPGRSVQTAPITGARAVADWLDGIDPMHRDLVRAQLRAADHG